MPSIFLTSGDLSSQGPAPQVLLALKSLTAVFGMGTGVASSVLPLDLSVVDKLRLASLLVVKNPQRNYHYASGFSLLAPSYTRF